MVEKLNQKKTVVFASSTALRADFEGTLKIYVPSATGGLSNCGALALLTATCSSIGLSRAFEYCFLENITEKTETSLI